MNPKSLGEHLCKRRKAQGLTQREAAQSRSINTWTYILWEKDGCHPTTRYYPAIFQFLGYAPFPAPQSLPERIAQKRRQLGLSIAQAANLIGVDEGTFGRWESGLWKPRKSQTAISTFLALKGGEAEG